MISPDVAGAELKLIYTDVSRRSAWLTSDPSSSSSDAGATCTEIICLFSCLKIHWNHQLKYQESKSF